jgi:hypothetical protein
VVGGFVIVEGRAFLKLANLWVDGVNTGLLVGAVEEVDFMPNLECIGFLGLLTGEIIFTFLPG